MHMTQGRYAGQKMSTIPSAYLNWMLKGATAFAADPESNIMDEAWLLLRERADGTLPMPWGKHRGTAIRDLSHDYLAWLLVGSNARSIAPRVFVEAQYVAEQLRRQDAEFQEALGKARRRQARSPIHRT
jgi:uncharacterized protein (DUF3820 family)